MRQQVQWWNWFSLVDRGDFGRSVVTRSLVW